MLGHQSRSDGEMRAGPAVRPARSCQVLPVTTNRVEIEKERLAGAAGAVSGAMGPQPDPVSPQWG